MSTQDESSDHPSKPVPDQESEYSLHLLVRLTGFGKPEHQAKTASEAKRLLEVGLQSDVEVSVLNMDGRSIGDLGLWHMSIERNDRNAQQERGEVE